MIAVVLCAVLLISKLVEATTFPSDGFGDVISMSRHHHRHVQRRQQQKPGSVSTSSTFLASVSFFARFWVRSVSISGAPRHHQPNVPTPGHIRVHVS
ncbi:Hypothetical protein, putative [Bodo saltans]|uniref:Membrane-associated protein n=1 Tax=Bodo saltans TaxID=75058 RepID=A0A0S4JDJ4_BODSA|nr:Hypothetical protein, putative [Bodo saltans]|eukprot:CUG88171.1 Hypothetical protein, putative [Bodo saltans]